MKRDQAEERMEVTGRSSSRIRTECGRGKQRVAKSGQLSTGVQQVSLWGIYSRWPVGPTLAGVYK